MYEIGIYFLAGILAGMAWYKIKANKNSPSPTEHPDFLDIENRIP